MSTLVLDIGRTHISASLVDQLGNILEHREIDNKTRTLRNIDVFDTRRIWDWFLEVIRDTCRKHQPTAIITTTHGASAALLEGASNGENKQILDVLDYESDQYASISKAYNQQRDDYAITGSPLLPRGLNMGRQLFWLQNTQAEIFRKCKWILPYPQYWAYLLSGVASSEVSSLGAHTDCWNPFAQTYSTLVHTQGWQSLFPPMRKAWDTLGSPRREICEHTGLSSRCKILCGIHDSNAAFAYHYHNQRAITLLSTGTWVIGMCASNAALSEQQDQLLNVNLLGEALPSFRFMGGREWHLLAGDIEGTPSLSHLNELISHQTMALPAFTNQGGPFGEQQGYIKGTCSSPLHQKALASLYCAQVTAWCLNKLSVTEQIIVDGPFVKDEIFLAVLAWLLPACEILTSTTSHGTALGAARLAIWPKSFKPEYRRIPGERHSGNNPQHLLSGLNTYHQVWCKMVNT